MPFLRDSSAAVCRILPDVRGRHRICRAVADLMCRSGAGEPPLVTFRMRDGSTMRSDLRSEMEKPVYWLGEYYEADMIRRIVSALPKGGTVLDIGANVGHYAVPIGLCLKKSGGHVHCFEPIRSNYNRLVEVIELNKLQDVVTCWNVALGNDEGVVNFFVEHNDQTTTGDAVMLPEGTTSHPVNDSARLTRLDDFAAQEGINACDFIKIDVEGAEYLAFLGGKDFLSRHRPIIYAECNRYWMEKFGHSLLDVVALTSQWDYTYYRAKDWKTIVAMDDPQVGMEDVLLVPYGTPEETVRKFGVVGPLAKRMPARTV